MEMHRAMALDENDERAVYVQSNDHRGQPLLVPQEEH